MSAHRLSRLNDGMSALTMGAPLTGLFEGDGEASMVSYGLAFLIVAMRVKFWIDDMEFFEDPTKGGARSDGWFRTGVALALASWVLFIIAGVMVRHPPVAAIWLLAALAVSSLWLLAEIRGPKSYPLQALWSASNLGYMGFAVVIAASPLIAARVPVPVEGLQWAAILCMGAILSVEIVKADWLQTLKTQIVESPASEPAATKPVRRRARPRPKA